jgi:hypothetical protein
MPVLVSPELLPHCTCGLRAHKVKEEKYMAPPGRGSKDLSEDFKGSVPAATFWFSKTGEARQVLRLVLFLSNDSHPCLDLQVISGQQLCLDPREAQYAMVLL